MAFVLAISVTAFLAGFANTHLTMRRKYTWVCWRVDKKDVAKK